MFFKTVPILLVAFLAVLVTVESVSVSPRMRCFSCRTTNLSEEDSCFAGDALTMPRITCHATHTHCSTITGFINEVPTVSRGCHQGCRESETVSCCSTHFCNAAETETVTETETETTTTQP